MNDFARKAIQSATVTTMRMPCLGGVGHEQVDDGESAKSGCRCDQKLPTLKGMQWRCRVAGQLLGCARVTDNPDVYARVLGGGDQRGSRYGGVMCGVSPAVCGIDFGEQDTRNSLPRTNHLRERASGQGFVDLQRCARKQAGVASCCHAGPESTGTL
jgi:hypothetical protein